MEKLKDFLTYGVVLGLMIAFYIWGYRAGRTYEKTLRDEAVELSHVIRLREVCERQYVMRDVGYYKGKVDNIRGDLTIDAEKLYYRWYAHCLAAGRRVDPNIIHWEDTQDVTK